MSRAIQNPKWPLLHASIVNSRTRFGQTINSTPTVAKTKRQRLEELFITAFLANRMPKGGLARVGICQL